MTITGIVIIPHEDADAFRSVLILWGIPASPRLQGGILHAFSVPRWLVAVKEWINREPALSPTSSVIERLFHTHPPEALEAAFLLGGAPALEQLVRQLKAP